MTIYTGEKLVLIQLENKNKIVSNGFRGGTDIYCNNFKCMGLTNNQNKMLMETLNRLCKLHKDKFRYIFSLGWDIMINCRGDKFNYYVLEGNLGGCWLYGNIPLIEKSRLIDMYLKKLDIFTNGGLK